MELGWDALGGELAAPAVWWCCAVSVVLVVAPPVVLLTRRDPPMGARRVVELAVGHTLEAPPSGVPIHAGRKWFLRELELGGESRRLGRERNFR